MMLSIMIANTLISRFGMWPYSLVTFPGTLTHELAHYFMALVFFASPSLPDIIPKRNGSSWTMGAVTFVPTLINSVPIALAPLLLMPASWLFAERVMHPAHGWNYLIYGWIAGNMLYACLPSRQDWRVAMPTLSIVMVVWILYELARR
ncbi:MAG: hypothetical protein PHQ60_02120 [Sideroxydans sp.]|nr:hypothetical protein [Sideroxydans sp.]MDD5056639.1 hypothetical protein [Sideroxydans sp.]